MHVQTRTHLVSASTSMYDAASILLRIRVLALASMDTRESARTRE